MPPRGSVLIIDNDGDSRDMYAEYLAFKGYTVETASDGNEGLVNARLHVPDVAVVDLTMPSVDGFAVIRALRADPRTGGVFVIVVTARALTGTEDEVRNAGADAYLSKPCLPEDLANAIEARPASRRRRR